MEQSSGFPSLPVTVGWLRPLYCAVCHEELGKEGYEATLDDESVVVLCQTCGDRWVHKHAEHLPQHS